MVTVGMDTHPLEDNWNLKVTTPCLFVEGVGCIGQWNTYAADPWRYGIFYFLRDLHSDAQEWAAVRELNKLIAEYEERTYSELHLNGQPRHSDAQPEPSHAPSDAL